MAKMQEFKCPCCGGSIEFDSSVQKMKCPFCDTEFDVGTLSEYAQTVEEDLFVPFTTITSLSIASQ